MRRQFPISLMCCTAAVVSLPLVLAACTTSEPNGTGNPAGTTAGSGGSSSGQAGSGGGGSTSSGGATGGGGGGGGRPGSADAGLDASAGAGGVRDAGMTGASGAGGTSPSLPKFIGNIDTRGQIRADFGTYWNQFSPENAGKWSSVEGTRDRMNWATLDRFYAYAKQNNIPFKEHNFLWGSQQPSWIAGLSQADQRAQVEEWIRLYCQRYPDTQLIDVVNEPPPHTTPPYVAALGGAGASGYDWIVQAFTWAHQYCPSSILILNDFNTIEFAADNNRMIDIVKRIKAAGAPIHGIGAQAHAAYQVSTATVQMYIDKLATQTGLPVYITEYDVNLADDTQQKNVMQSQITMFWNDANVKGITLWGYIVGQTWMANTGLMTTTGTMRPAMTWLAGFLPSTR